MPKYCAVAPILSVQTLVFGGIFLAPLRRKFKMISNDLGQTSRNISLLPNNKRLINYKSTYIQFIQSYSPFLTISASLEFGCCESNWRVDSNLVPPAFIVMT